MSGRNDDTSGMVFVLAFFGAGMLILGMIIFAIAILMALVMTPIAVAAWDRPLTIFGATTYPHDARWFVYRGLIGMAALPAFAWFFSALYGLQVDDALWSWLVIGGYTGGTVGVELLIDEEDGKPAVDVTPPTLPSAPPPAPIERHPAPPVKPVPFIFAVWDDEKKRR